MLRIGFDMDGVIADFGSAFRNMEARLFGPGPSVKPPSPELEEEKQSGKGKHVEPVEDDADDPKTAESALSPRELGRRRDAVWQALESTPNFWESLEPTESGVVERIHEMMLRHRWEVFFITQRPATEGDTVQRQTQRWLVKHGFDLPSVLVIGGSRGAAAGALRLDYHVDDNAQNCVDVISDSKAKVILIVSDADPLSIATARRLGIGTAPSIGACLDVLEQASIARSQPSLLQRIAAAIGWKSAEGGSR
jgi:hypothetical protein